MKISDFFKDTLGFIVEINKTKREKVVLNALKGNWNGVLVECINEIVPMTKKEHIFNYSDEELNKILDASFVYGVNRLITELNNYYNVDEKKKQEILQDLNESIKTNNHLIQVIPNKYIYHTSNPIFRNKISKEGLIVKGKSETWLSNTNIDGEVIFAVNSDNKKDLWNSTYDDDIYRIETISLNNKWYNDPNFDLKDKRIITFENIPTNSIKLIYKGTGDSE